MDISTINGLTLTSISGVVVATMVIVSVMKRSLYQKKYIKTLPVWCYAILIANTLGLLAHYFIKINGKAVLLPDTNIWVIIWGLTGAAATSSGFFTWINDPTHNLEDARLDDLTTPIELPPETTITTPSSSVLKVKGDGK